MLYDYNGKADVVKAVKREHQNLILEIIERKNSEQNNQEDQQNVK